MSRWIPTYVSVFENEFFAPSIYSEREAWIWLNAKAAWKDTRHRIGGQVVPVPVGSFFTTLRQLQKTWMWASDCRVRNFLKRLEQEGMIMTDSSAGKTRITICNYDSFSKSERRTNARETQPERNANAQKTPDLQFTKSHQKKEASGHTSFDEFYDWFKDWPTAPSDDADAARLQWEALSETQRSQAVGLTLEYLESVRASGRTVWPSAAKYLQQHMWERVVKRPTSDLAQVSRSARSKPIDSKQDSHFGIPTVDPRKSAARGDSKIEYIREAIRKNNEKW